jgi:hypothetical protein
MFSRLLGGLLIVQQRSVARAGVCDGFVGSAYASFIGTCYSENKIDTSDFTSLDGSVKWVEMCQAGLQNILQPIQFQSMLRLCYLPCTSSCQLLFYENRTFIVPNYPQGTHSTHPTTGTRAGLHYLKVHTRARDRKKNGLLFTLICRTSAIQGLRKAAQNQRIFGQAK